MFKKNAKNAKRASKVAATDLGSLGSAEARENPAVVALQTATRALDRQNELQARVRDLEAELQDRDRLLDGVVDIAFDEDNEFSASDRIEEIQGLFPDDDDEGED